MLLGRASSIVEDRSHGTIKEDSSAPVKLDAAAISHIEKHRYQPWKFQVFLTNLAHFSSYSLQCYMVNAFIK